MNAETGLYLDYSLYRQRLPRWVEKQKLALSCPVPNDFNFRVAKKVEIAEAHELVGLCMVLALEYGATDNDFAALFDLIRDDLVIEPRQIDAASINRTLESRSIEEIKQEIFLAWERRGLAICQQLAVRFDRYLADVHGNDWPARGGLMQFCLLVIDVACQVSFHSHRQSGERRRG